MKNDHFEIGATAYVAQFQSVSGVVTCPDCLGTLRMRVFMGNGEEHSVACGRCSNGYNPPTGYIEHTKNATAKVIKITISGLEISNNQSLCRYSAGDYSYDGKDVFATKEEAMQRAQVLAEEHAEREIERLASKEHDTRSWAWNVSYHRRCIKDAEKSIAYHTSKLNVAPANPKAADAKDEVKP